MITYTCGSLVATGTTQGTAALITTDHVTMTSTGAGQGVILPTGCHRVVCWNNNPPAGNSINVYPPTGAKISNGAVNAAFNMGVPFKIMFVELSSTQWVVANLT